MHRDPVFQAAYNQWQDELEQDARARPATLADTAINAMKKTFEDGDARLALELFRGNILLGGTAVRLTEVDELEARNRLDRKRRRMKLERENRKLDVDEKTERYLDRGEIDMAGGLRNTIRVFGVPQTRRRWLGYTQALEELFRMNTDNRLVVQSFLARFRDQKQTVERAVGQVPDDKLHQPLDENTNSLTVIMKHMAGNLRSRFSDFLTSDGEKPDRDRDSEFVDDLPDRAALMAFWESGWKCLFESLGPLTDNELPRTVTIRGQVHSVADALARALAHQAYHVGQIVQLARFLAKDRWETMTIARGQSSAFNAKMSERSGR